MKKFILLCFFATIGIHVYGQNDPVINVGAGLSYVVSSLEYSARTHNFEGYNFVVEKPLSFNSYKNIFLSIHPEIRYEKLREYYETSGLGRWYSYDHVLRAAFVQSKVLINSRLKSSSAIYTGVCAAT